MADALAPNYQLNQPEVGGSSGSWGGKLDVDMALIDKLLAMPRPRIAVSTTGVLDLATGLVQQITVDADKVISFVNVPVKEVGGVNVSTFVWLLVIGGSAHAVTYPGTVTWTSGIAPTLGAGSDLLMFLTGDQGASWTGYHIGKVDNGQITQAMLAPGAGVRTDLLGALGNLETTSDVEVSMGTIVVPGASLATGRSLRIRSRWWVDFPHPDNHVYIKFGGTYVATLDGTAGPLWDVDIIVGYHGASSQTALIIVNAGTLIGLTIIPTTENEAGAITVDFRAHDAGGGFHLRLESATVELIRPS